jgi:2-keto-3-deoxy-L-fuconate dehydrogenase
MSNRLAGKTALVTAAGQGIGRATAIAFADEGAAVWATDINENGLRSLAAARPGIVVRRMDVRDSRAIEKVAEEIESLEILFNCAGYVHSGTILETSEMDWDFSFDLNVKSMYRTCRTFLPKMRHLGRVSIINVASVASSIKGVPNRFVYCATKGAVIGLSKALAADLVSRGIRCNAICPGTVSSPSFDERMAAHGDAEKARAEFIARQPMGRLGQPEEIAALAVYLASDESAFTTGQIHIVDGGWSM